ncbi:recombination protein RecR [Spiroplasma sp. TIUS-1]|uniref:toprim domain-containing protein n=1 Tax=Spiroplasma sp. TIUS-1 TaxID=216963 RepID=UPI001398BF82|nr:toprim domain-containing protein [Spiroplasma sp. TIUS-1]QHX35563.1 recombination protein RecR [Spiroplasma sp. TIUS-1]
MIEDIILKLKGINGISTKTAEKILFDLISNDKLDDLTEVIAMINSDLSLCDKCFFVRENKKCIFCDANDRNNSKLCVVATIADGFRISKSKYDGLIHVLGGEIDLRKNILPDSLDFNSLISRVNNFKEVILAFNYTIEGEVTSNYIIKRLSTKKIKVTKLAKGMPVGNVLDYVDETTLNDAFKNRK